MGIPAINGDFLKWGVPPKSSILKGCSLTKTIDVGVSPFMETMVFLPKMVASPTYSSLNPWNSVSTSAGFV